MMSWGGRVTEASCPPMAVPSGLFIVFVNKYDMSYACVMLGMCLVHSKCWVMVAIPLWTWKPEKSCCCAYDIFGGTRWERSSSS